MLCRAVKAVLPRREREVAFLGGEAEVRSPNWGAGIAGQRWQWRRFGC